jgi:subtilisin-like proprotein convertase family protein
VKHFVSTFASLMLLGALVACGPSASGDDDDDDDDGGRVDSGVCVPSTEICDDVTDNDCNGLADCDDQACAGSNLCPNANCGEIQHPEASLALPDGEGNSYMSSINFTGFSDGQVLSDPSKLLAVCVNMEHSWLRDLQIEISCPTGRTVVLQMFLGQEGSEVFMGIPDDTDDIDPVPGTGFEYCWAPAAGRTNMLQYVDDQGAPFHFDLPAGDYRPVGSWQELLNCPLNGNWTIKVQDLWGIDNGFIFSWGMKFDPSIIEDCTNWPPIG